MTAPKVSACVSVKLFDENCESSDDDSWYRDDACNWVCFIQKFTNFSNLCITVWCRFQNLCTVSACSSGLKLISFNPKPEQSLRRRKEQNLQWVPLLATAVLINRGLFCSLYFLGICTTKKQWLLLFQRLVSLWVIH